MAGHRGGHRGAVLLYWQAREVPLALARFLSVFVAIFAGYTLVSLVLSLRTGMPLQISAKVHGQCIEMPAETFAWAKHMVVEHEHLHRGVSFVARHMHMHADSTTIVVENASHPAIAHVGVEPAVEPEQWSTIEQPEACTNIAHFVACVSKTMMIGSAFAHLLLFLVAVAVVRRAIVLRCAAYRAGLLKWKCGARCKSACKRVEPVQPQKEMA